MPAPAELRNGKDRKTVDNIGDALNASVQSMYENPTLGIFFYTQSPDIANGFMFFLKIADGGDAHNKAPYNLRIAKDKKVVYQKNDLARIRVTETKDPVFDNGKVMYEPYFRYGETYLEIDKKGDAKLQVPLHFYDYSMDLEEDGLAFIFKNKSTGTVDAKFSFFQPNYSRFLDEEGVRHLYVFDEYTVADVAISPFDSLLTCTISRISPETFAVWNPPIIPNERGHST